MLRFIFEYKISKLKATHSGIMRIRIDLSDCKGLSIFNNNFEKVVGILITLSPEFGKALGVGGDVKSGATVAYCYGGLVLGDIMISVYQPFI